MVNASGSSFCTISKLNTGTVNAGSALEIVYKSPIVFTGICKPFTMAIPAITARSDGGIVSLIIGQTIRIARHTAPTMTACTLMVLIKRISPTNLSIVSISGSSETTVRPRKSLICPIKIVTAIPAVKPVVIVYGIYLIRLPIRQTPIMIRIIPAITVASASPSIPFSAAMPATIVANAAVGPAICTRLPPRNEITNPAVIAV